MALIDVRCEAGHISEVYRSIHDWPATPACPECGATTEQVHLPKRTVWSVDPVVVFKAPDGSYRFPGDAHGSQVGQYEKWGYERVEIRGAAEMRSFESRMNKAEYSKAMRQTERLHEARERREKESRSKLRDAMVGMSEFGKAVARAAMQRNDDRPLKRTSHSGFHSEVFAYDRSNRDESRGSDGRRRRD